MEAADAGISNYCNSKVADMIKQIVMLKKEMHV
jgi:hypothetical protein